MNNYDLTYLKEHLNTYYQTKEGYIMSYDEVDKIYNYIKQKENIIKEVREFVEEWKYKDGDGSVYFDINTNPDDLLEILDKGE